MIKLIDILLSEYGKSQREYILSKLNHERSDDTDSLLNALDQQGISYQDLKSKIASEELKNIEDLEKLRITSKTDTKKQNKSEVTKFLDNEDFLIIQPNSYKANCYYGANTKWCTTDKEQGKQKWEDYTTFKPVTFIIDKSKPQSDPLHKVAFSYESSYSVGNKNWRDLPLQWKHELFIWDAEDKDVTEKIYNQYLEAFQKGVYNYIREDLDPQTGDILKAKTFKAGGMRNTSSHDIRLRLSLDLMGAKYKYVTGYRGLSKVAAGVLQNETQYSCGSVPNYRGMVEPNLINTGKALTMWYYSPMNAQGKEVKFADLSGIPTFLDVYKKLHGGMPSGDKYTALKVVNNLATFMLRGSFVPAGTPKAAVDALRAAWEALPGDKEFVNEYRKAFKAEPKIIQSGAAQAHVNNVKSIDPKVVNFLKKYIKGS